MAASWIDQASGSAGADTRAVLDALEDADLAREQELRELELELLHKRVLLDMLDDVAERLEVEACEIDERLATLDAEMHLALARGLEEQAREAILRIIRLRRRLRALRAEGQRIDKERRRLAATLGRHARALEQLEAQAPTPPPSDRTTARTAHGRPGTPFSKGAPAQPGRAWLTPLPPCGKGGF
jgi:hypothetical protein